MSDFQVSPVIIERIKYISKEMDELCGLALSIDYQSRELWTGFARQCLEDLQERFNDPLMEVSYQGGVKGPEGEPNPYAIAAVLQSIAREGGRVFAVFTAASQDMDRAEALTVQWLGFMFSTLAETAGHLAETVLEEAPPLPQN